MFVIISMERDEHESATDDDATKSIVDRNKWKCKKKKLNARA